MAKASKNLEVPRLRLWLSQREERQHDHIPRESDPGHAAQLCDSCGMALCSDESGPMCEGCYDNIANSQGEEEADAARRAYESIHELP